MDVQIQKENMETYQMDGRVEVFPDQSVVLNISDQKVICVSILFTNLMKFCWVTLPVLRYRIP